MIAGSVLLHSWTTTVFADLITHAPAATPEPVAATVVALPAAA
jgi:hypothetical protein